MALVATITAKLFPTIGAIGESAGFTDFTPAQLASNGHIQTISRSFSLDAKTILVGQTSVTTGKADLMTAIDTAVTLYLATIFTDPAKAYDAKIYVLNVKRISDAIAGVADIDLPSVYVDRDDTFYVDVKMNIGVA